ncbi:MAG TPA: hypothetical protein VGM20_05765 [Gemmatimonadales bacterium]|jgi:hypothetical protein
MIRRVLSALALSALVTTAGCSSSDSTTGPGGGGGPQGNFGMSATINGQAWAAAAKPSVAVSNGIFAMAGLNLTYGISMAVVQATGPGTYSLTYLNTPGSSGIVASGTGGGWDTYAPGGSGSVTFTTFTSNHVVGTFSMVAAAVSGGATGTLTVTNGAFDVTY